MDRDLINGSYRASGAGKRLSADINREDFEADDFRNSVV
jgi:hypothetical protein